MRALVKWGDGPGEADVREVPAPGPPPPGSVLVEVAGCGLCGSDLHAVASDPGYAWVRTPRVLGHEFVGVVTATGDGVPAGWEGTPVGVVSILGCLQCPLCLAGSPQLCDRRSVIGLSFDGGAAEAVHVPAARLVELPLGLALDVAVLLEPLTVAHHAVDVAGVRAGQRVVVSGPGPVGLLAAHVARIRGADVTVVGRAEDAARLGAARSLGVAATDGTPPRGADVWIEAAGAGPALVAALDAVATGGTVGVVALYGRTVTLDLTPAVRRELRVLTSYGSTPADYAACLDLLVDGATALRPLVTTFPLDDALPALDAARAATVVKPVLTPTP